MRQVLGKYNIIMRQILVSSTLSLTLICMVNENLTASQVAQQYLMHMVRVTMDVSAMPNYVITVFKILE